MKQTPIYRFVLLMMSFLLLNGVVPTAALTAATTTDPKASTNSETKISLEPLPLKEAFKYFEKMPKETVSVYVKDLKSGRSYGINETFINKDKEAGMMAASVIKLHLAYHIIHELDAKKIKWDTLYKDPVTGRQFTIRSEMKKMITISDNGAYNTLLRFMKPADINKAFKTYQLTHTRVHAELGPAGDGWSAANNIKRYKTTKGGRINAFETATMLEDIYNRKDEPNMKILHSFMLSVTNKDRIPSAVGKHIPVAHKTGSMQGKDGVFDDVGIVYGKHGDYLICVLVQKQKIAIDLETRAAVKAAFTLLEKMNAR